MGKFTQLGHWRFSSGWCSEKVTWRWEETSFKRLYYKNIELSRVRPGSRRWSRTDSRNKLHATACLNVLCIKSIRQRVTTWKSFAVEKFFYPKKKWIITRNTTRRHFSIVLRWKRMVKREQNNEKNEQKVIMKSVRTNVNCGNWELRRAKQMETDHTVQQEGNLFLVMFPLSFHHENPPIFPESFPSIFSPNNKWVGFGNGTLRNLLTQLGNDTLRPNLRGRMMKSLGKRGRKRFLPIQTLFLMRAAFNASFLLSAHQKAFHSSLTLNIKVIFKPYNKRNCSADPQDEQIRVSFLTFSWFFWGKKTKRRKQFIWFTGTDFRTNKDVICLLQTTRFPNRFEKVSLMFQGFAEREDELTVTWSCNRHDPSSSCAIGCERSWFPFNLKSSSCET